MHQKEGLVCCEPNGNLAEPGLKGPKLTRRESERREVEGLFLFSTYRFFSDRPSEWRVCVWGWGEQLLLPQHK